MTQPESHRLPKLPAWKRVFDLLSGGLALILLSPALLLLALLIRVTMGSPVLFRQARPGLNRRIFTAYKFRTMTEARDAEGRLRPDRDRLTPIGRLLRKTSLDELPQLLNVLRGEMSLVGPRPLLPEYLPHYTAREAMRHNVRPGITGLAQVSGRNELNWDERLELDARYVDELSPKLDFMILLRTVASILRRHGIAEDSAVTEGNLADLRSRDPRPHLTSHIHEVPSPAHPSDKK